jgi:hypothetical protein
MVYELQAVDFAGGNEGGSSMLSGTCVGLTSRFILGATIFIVLAAFGSAQAATVFVDSRVADCGDGQSWATAYKYLQDALTAARNSGGAITEIWVAAGTYQPDRDCTHPTGSLSRTATFQLINDVALRGGFAGNEDPATFDLADRDFQANQTILSGDLAGDDGPDFANNDENAYHVLKASGVASGTIFDGFTISGGNANDSTSSDSSGGGMYLSSGSLTLANCTFSGNTADWHGGGLCNVEFSNPAMTN